MKLFGGLPANGRAAGPQIAAIDAFVCQRVVGIALALGPFSGEAEIEPIVHDGDVDHPLEAALLVIADFARCHRFELIGRFGSGDVHHTRGRVAPIERTLRPAQHFQLSDVEEFLFEEMISDERRVVQGHCDSRVGGHRDRLGADAADVDAVAAEIRFGEGKVRHLFHQIGAARGLRGGQLLLAQRGDRDGDALHICAAEFRRGNRHRFHRRTRWCGLGELEGGGERGARIDLRARCGHDADAACGIALRHETGAGQDAAKRIVGRQVALHAACAGFAQRFIGIDQRGARLLGIFVKRGFQIAAWNVEAFCRCSTRKRDGAEQQARGECFQAGLGLHAPPLIFLSKRSA